MGECDVATYRYIQAMSVRYNPEVWLPEAQQQTSVGFSKTIERALQFADAYRERAGVTVYF